MIVLPRKRHCLTQSITKQQTIGQLGEGVDIGQSLEQVLTDKNPSNRHGNVKALSEGEREALIDFLKTL